MMTFWYHLFIFFLPILNGAINQKITNMLNYATKIGNLLRRFLTSSTKNYDIEANLAYLYIYFFCPFLPLIVQLLEPLRILFHQFNLAKRPNMASWCVPTILHPFQPEKGPLGLFVWPKGNFCFAYFGKLFGSLWATFGTFWV